MSSLMNTLGRSLIAIAATAILFGCAGDPMESGLDPFAPMTFKEGVTKMPLNPPNPATLQKFYVSNNTSFQFAVDTSSILIGSDGVTRYIVVITSPNQNQQIQYEGIRCDTYQWRLYGNFENNTWRENPLSTWKEMKTKAPNRYQASLAQGAFCDLNTQEKSINTILKSLNPDSFIGGTKPSNSFGLID